MYHYHSVHIRSVREQAYHTYKKIQYLQHELIAKSIDEWKTEYKAPVAHKSIIDKNDAPDQPFCGNSKHLNKYTVLRSA